MSRGWKDEYLADEIERVPCPGCDANQPIHLATEWTLGIVRCGACGLVYVSPRMRESELNYFGDVAAVQQKYGDVFLGKVQHDRTPNYHEHVSTLERFASGRRLLDVGTHCGFFLATAKRRGWDCIGIEPSPANAELARVRFGLDVRLGFLDSAELPEREFDAATILDVLEHVTTPRRLLSGLRDRLRPGGIALIKVPNARYNLLKHRVRSVGRLRSMDVFDAREHVVHYTPETLTKVLGGAGFRVEHVYVPRPVQSGAHWKRPARAVMYGIGTAIFRATGRYTGWAPDVAVVARRVP